MTTNTNALFRKSAQLQTIFGWAFGIGSFLLFSEAAYMPLKGLILSIGSPDATTALADFATMIVRLLPAVALLGALWAARSLFKTYAAGAILTVAGGRQLGRMGDWLTASAVLALLFGSASSKMDSVTGAYIGTQVALLCVGLAIRLLGQVQSLAAEIKADNDQIV